MRKVAPNRAMMMAWNLVMWFSLDAKDFFEFVELLVSQASMHLVAQFIVGIAKAVRHIAPQVDAKEKVEVVWLCHG
jgi:hypothetical protein